MEHFTPISALIGGALIGGAAGLLLWLDGRIAGISGILGGLLPPEGGEALWRVLFLTGLILSAQPFRLDWNVAGATVMSNLLQPLLVVAIVYAIPVPSDVAKVAILMAALPSGFFGILFGVNYGVASAETGSIIIAATVSSVPEPATWTMMILGFGFIGFMLRGNRRESLAVA